jgi:hypothetical protein
MLERHCVLSYLSDDWENAYCPVQLFLGCGSGMCLSWNSAALNLLDFERRKMVRRLYYVDKDMIHPTYARGI